jgi:hypothetical protein
MEEKSVPLYLLCIFRRSPDFNKAQQQQKETPAVTTS